MTETLMLVVKGNTTDAVSALGDLERAGAKIKNTENRMTTLGQKMTRTLTPAFAGVGAASAIAFQKFDAGADALRAAGATGDDFVESMKSVGSQVPASLEEVGTVMGELYQRTKLTGEPLEDLTQQVLELGELGQSVNVEQLTASLSKAGVEAEDMAGALDLMFRVSQTTGTSVEKLSQLQEQFGASLDLAGFSMEDQLLLLGQMEAAGVNTGGVMAGMTRAMREFADSGEDPAQALAELMDRMKGAKTDAEAVAIATDTFGRSSVEVAAAVRNGTLDLAEMQAALAGNTDTIHDAAAGTRDWQEQLQMMQNKLVGVLGPLGQYGTALGGIGMVIGPALTGVGKFSEAHPQLTSNVGAAAAAAGGAAAVWASYTMMMDNARDSATAAAEAIQAAMTEGAPSTDEFAASMQRLATETVGMAEDVEGSISPLDIDYRAALRRMIDENVDFLNQGDLMLQQADAIGGAFGIGADAALGWLIEQQALGTEFTNTQEAMLGYQGSVSETTGTTEAQTRSIEESIAALQEWESALRAQFDPLFAMNEAIRAQKEAQDAANGATWLYGPASDAAAEANLALAEANLTATTAAAELKAGIENGTVSLAESQATLDGWVASGLMTEEQAASVAWQFGLVTGAANQIPTNVHTNVTADASQALAAAQAIADTYRNVATSFTGMVSASRGGGIAAFDDGGVVPGPLGAPRLILAHGGETVLPTHKDPAAGNTSVNVYLDGQLIERVVSKKQRRTGLERV